LLQLTFVAATSNLPFGLCWYPFAARHIVIAEQAGGAG